MHSATVSAKGWLSARPHQCPALKTVYRRLRSSGDLPLRFRHVERCHAVRAECGRQRWGLCRSFGRARGRQRGPGSADSVKLDAVHCRARWAPRSEA